MYGTKDHESSVMGRKYVTYYFHPQCPHANTKTAKVQLWDMDGLMNQAYSRLSTTHGHITDCKLVCLYWTRLVMGYGRFT